MGKLSCGVVDSLHRRSAVSGANGELDSRTDGGSEISDRGSLKVSEKPRRGLQTFKTGRM